MGDEGARKCKGTQMNTVIQKRFIVFLGHKLLRLQIFMYCTVFVLVKYELQTALFIQ